VSDWELWTIERVIATTRVSESTVYRHMREGRLKATHIGRALRFKPEDVQRWIDSGDTNGQEEIA
jgi:excisionase family DNA binding protein